MKWYFACNEKSSHLFPLIEGAINSAIKNTSLKPYFIYDGQECEFTQKLRSQGVEIMFHRVSFYDALCRYYNKAGLNIASGAFLRCDIPIIEKEDDFILYTDCDVLFLKDFDLDLQPKYFACSSQSEKNNFSHFNTGVMLMNIKNLKKTHKEFSDFIVSNLPQMEALDQSAYQIFYSDKNTKLPIKYNHKPYWGVDEKAVILHFHGPKPLTFLNDKELRNLNYNYYILYIMNPQAYDFYLEFAKQYIPNIDYDYNAIMKLKTGVYPLVKVPRNKLSVRIKNKIRKSFTKFVNKFKNRAIFK